MRQVTVSDVETLQALAGRLDLNHQAVVELIQSLHTIRAHMAGAAGIIKNILERAEERARPGEGVDPATMPRFLRPPASER